MSVYEAGMTGEDMALHYLKQRGCEEITRRWRAQDGEIDLIVRDGDYVVFVEVKYRPGGRAGDGFRAVTAGKQRRMAHAALAFLVQREWMNVPVRFDVVEITKDGIRHVPNAFQPVG